VLGHQYFAPVPRIAKGNSKEHCARSFDAVWVDVDRTPSHTVNDLLNEVRDTLAPLDLWPSTIVYSGNRGLHLYWKVSEDLAIEDTESLNKGLSALLAGDACHDRTHFMRHPGTINVKSGRRAELIDMTGEVLAISRFDHVPRSLTVPGAQTRSRASRVESCGPWERPDWLGAAEALGGWKAPENVDFNVLLAIQRSYMAMTPPPTKAPRDGTRSRSEIEQAILYRLAGKGCGASDAQLEAIADEYLHKHRELAAVGNRQYLRTSINNARARHYDNGWITSPLGGAPRKRDVGYRWANINELQRYLTMADGLTRAQWVARVVAGGRSKSTAYRWLDGYQAEGLLTTRDGRLEVLGWHPGRDTQ
jgi:hypothetical protein